MSMTIDYNTLSTIALDFQTKKDKASDDPNCKTFKTARSVLKQEVLKVLKDNETSPQLLANKLSTEGEKVYKKILEWGKKENRLGQTKEPQNLSQELTLAAGTLQTEKSHLNEDYTAYSKSRKAFKEYVLNHKIGSVSKEELKQHLDPKVTEKTIDKIFYLATKKA